jgi:hypothetical protein
MESPPQDEPFRVGFVPGVTPDRWARVWRERYRRTPLSLVQTPTADQLVALDDGRLHMCFVRDVERTEVLHLIPLYEEVPVVVVGKEHPASVYDEITVDDLADEHLLQDPDEVPAWRDVAAEVRDGTRHPVPEMTVRQAVETVAAGSGVLVLPMSVARLHNRRDVAHVPVTGIAGFRVGLAWRRDLTDGRVEAFVGVVRGRTERSTRGAERR